MREAEQFAKNEMKSCYHLNYTYTSLDLKLVTGEPSFWLCRSEGERTQHLKSIFLQHIAMQLLLHLFKSTLEASHVEKSSG